MFLQICWTALLGGSAAAGGGVISAQDVVVACVPQDIDAVSLIDRTPDGVFVDVSGRRFLPVDIRSGALTAAQAGHLEYTGVSTDLGRFEAIPAGPVNRWGLVPAWIIEYRDDTRYLFQAIQLERGEALFAPKLADGVCADLLRGVERSARSQELGIWKDPENAPFRETWRVKEFGGLTGRYVIARGRIVSLGKTRSTRYLNFGNFWKTDFTVTWKSADEDSFDATLGRSGWRIEDLKGKTVEVRGVVQMRDGPLVTLRHPEQLVVLENKRAARGGQNSD
ncbi:MAG: hypothetical protein K5905_26425 [Roseibium sp.]|uniref:hypothetical protein n=1 Tax=Roseibium sp. TaxID=1936156 RepID=UPI0026245AD2|nr:hypothetical protein [Roseibium sp.]MCV0429006.1 hypothetical protein [Roseibium sp.]